jgi:hypothetical protein
VEQSDLEPDALVFLFGHRFAKEWVDRKADPVFGRIPVDSRSRVAPVTGEVLSEKSLAEAITYASLASLIVRLHVEAAVIAEKGWNHDVYDRVYLQPRETFPESPLYATLERVIERARVSPWVHARKRLERDGIAVDHLCAGVRRFRWLRADPYQHVCAITERHVMERGLYRTERVHVAGPFLAPVPQPDVDRILEYEPAVARLERTLEDFELEEPILAAALRDNVERSLLKTRSDEEYAKERYGDMSPVSEILNSAEEGDDLPLIEREPRS